MPRASAKTRQSARRVLGWTSSTLEHVLLLPDPPFLILTFGIAGEYLLGGGLNMGA
jgi:hypothetical protein